ncbi:MAG: DUF5825 family protein [Kibdelosporangium sp.]
MRVLPRHPAWPEFLTVSEPVPGLATQAVAAGQTLALAEPVRFGEDGRRDVAILNLLAEAAAYLVAVEWELAGELPWPVRQVVQLPAPAASADPAVLAWRERHRHGLCTYRVGPGFVSVVDLRPDGPKASITVPGEWVDVFTALAASADTPDDGPGRVLFDRLESADLVLNTSADTYFLVPYRPRRWPVVQHTGLPNGD